jgi:ABC-type antimicrobial peptide transport system permease subunit
MLTESVLLAMISGIAGLLLSVWGTKFLATLIPVGIAPLTGTGVDGRVLLFTLAVTLTTGVLFGIIPASRVSQFHLTRSLKQGGGQSGVGSAASGCATHSLFARSLSP